MNAVRHTCHGILGCVQGESGKRAHRRRRRRRRHRRRRRRCRCRRRRRDEGYARDSLPPRRREKEILSGDWAPGWPSPSQRRRPRIVADRRRSSPVTSITRRRRWPSPALDRCVRSVFDRASRSATRDSETRDAGNRESVNRGSTASRPRNDATPRSGPGRREAAFFFPVLSACSNSERDISPGRNEESRLVRRKTGSIVRMSVKLTAFNLIFFLSVCHVYRRRFSLVIWAILSRLIFVCIY